MTTKVDGASGSESAVSDGSQNDSSPTVTREAHDRLLAQRKADRVKLVEAEKERDALRAQAEAAETARLEADKQYKTLAETAEKKRIAAEAKVAEMTAAQVEAAKRSALTSVLGVKKTEFLKFADMSSIQMNDDGSVDAESVTEVANKFRKDYPELLTVAPKSKLPNEAAADHRPAPTKPLHEYTQAELSIMLANSKNKK